jgi:Flp pilus assembly protein TadD
MDLEAIDAAKKAQESDPNRPGTIAILAAAYLRSGQTAKGQRLFATMLQKQKAGEFPASWIAIAYRGIGDMENALRWLDKAMDERGVVLLSLKEAEAWDPLRSDPRFASLLKRI